VPSRESGHAGLPAPLEIALGAVSSRIEGSTSRSEMKNYIEFAGVKEVGELPSAGHSTSETVANRVFVGCPWHTVRPKYERVIDELRNRFPLHFLIIGRDNGQEAKDLLDHIVRALLSSSFAIFDATGGNPNVSLEYGIAEASSIPRALYLSTHAASQTVAKDSPIIADLAGKTRNHYTQEPVLKKLISGAAKEHRYTQRFERFLHKAFGHYGKGTKRSARALALKVIHSLDGTGTRRRTDIVQDLQAENYRGTDIDLMIRLLHKGELVRSEPGRYSTVSIT
jgi:hypothetical protein